MSVEWKTAGLLLVGHGSSRIPTAGDAVRRIAAALRAKQLFADVQAAFWREDPKVGLDIVTTERLYVVPFFAGQGKHTEQLIPQALGVSGSVTHRDGRTIHYTPPLGAHAAIPGLLCRRALALCTAEGLTPSTATLLLIGHGSRAGDATRTPEAIAEAIRGFAPFAAVVVAYLEQQPAVQNWTSLVDTPNVIAMPLLVADGMHANEDLPPLFGQDRTDGDARVINGHRVWLLSGIGHDDEISSMILDLVRAAS